MKYFEFENGDKIPMLGLGTWKSDKGVVYQAIRKSIEIGYRHFDCAYLYGNEKEIGDALSDAMKAGDVLREELWITSKLWNNRHKKHQVEPAFDITLKDLQCDYLDLYLIHWPGVGMKLAETFRALNQLVREGKVRHLGVSSECLHLGQRHVAGRHVHQDEGIEGRAQPAVGDVAVVLELHRRVETAGAAGISDDHRKIA
jgi:alcohol dehydrogenase (NADP+)